MTSSEFSVTVEGLAGLPDFSKIDDKIAVAASRAINKTATQTRTDGARSILQQLNFPASYLRPSSGRLVVAERAKPDKLKSTITARRRATSLARFLVSNPNTSRGAGVRVLVGKKNGVRTLKGAFPIKLRRGAKNTDSAFNAGVAYRVKPGQAPPGSSPKEISPGLYLLYGVSVNQAYKAVSRGQVGKAAKLLEKEFLRVLEI